MRHAKGEMQGFHFSIMYGNTLVKHCNTKMTRICCDSRQQLTQFSSQTSACGYRYFNNSNKNMHKEEKTLNSWWSLCRLIPFLCENSTHFLFWGLIK